jgi:hypothetical protein
MLPREREDNRGTATFLQLGFAAVVSACPDEKELQNIQTSMSFEPRRSFAIAHSTRFAHFCTLEKPCSHCTLALNFVLYEKLRRDDECTTNTKQTQRRSSMTNNCATCIIDGCRLTKLCTSSSSEIPSSLQKVYFIFTHATKRVTARSCCLTYANRLEAARLHWQRAAKLAALISVTCTAMAKTHHH